MKYREGMGHPRGPCDTTDRTYYKSLKPGQQNPSLPLSEKLSHSDDFVVQEKGKAMASSSNPEPTMEERLSELQSELDRIKIQAKEQSNLMLSMDIVGANRWESLNQELKSIREDVNSDVEAKFKGMEKVLGTLQHHVSKLKRRSRSFPNPGPKIQNPRTVQTKTRMPSPCFSLFTSCFCFSLCFSLRQLSQALRSPPGNPSTLWNFVLRT
jgi:hypothetical protein